MHFWKEPRRVHPITRHTASFHIHRGRSQKKKASVTVCVRSLGNAGRSWAGTRQPPEKTGLVVVNGSWAAFWDRPLPAASPSLSVFQAAGRWWDVADGCSWADFFFLFVLFVGCFFKAMKSLHWLGRCIALRCQKCENVRKYSHFCYSSSLMRDTASPWAGCHSYGKQWKNRAEWRNL